LNTSQFKQVILFSANCRHQSSTRHDDSAVSCVSKNVVVSATSWARSDIFGVFGRRSYFVELFTGSSPWSNTEFRQFSRKLLKTWNYFHVIKHIRRSVDASWYRAIWIHDWQWCWH